MTLYSKLSKLSNIYKDKQKNEIKDNWKKKYVRNQIRENKKKDMRYKSAKSVKNYKKP